jgi:hypothetical protein
MAADERLYRDDVGAALERVRRLEQENQALRAEIEDIKAGRAPVLPSPYRVGTIALCIATIAVGATLAFSSATQPSVVVYQPVPPPPPAMFEPQPVAAPTLNTAPTPRAMEAACSPPYYYDARGTKVFKKECL